MWLVVCPDNLQRSCPVDEKSRRQWWAVALSSGIIPRTLSKAGHSQIGQVATAAGTDSLQPIAEAAQGHKAAICQTLAAREPQDFQQWAIFCHRYHSHIC